MHYSVRTELIDQIAKRMNPAKYTWTPKDKAEVLESAEGLLLYIEGFQKAVETQERASTTIKLFGQGILSDGRELTNDPQKGVFVPPSPIWSGYIPIGENVQYSTRVDMSTGYQRDSSVDPQADR